MRNSNGLSAIAITVSIGLASLAAIAPTVSAQTGLPVGQGQSITVGSLLGGETATVDPPDAGTLRFEGIPGDFVTVDFTASTTYLGPVTIRWTNLVGESLAAPFVVSGDNSSAQATFTPRPAPGPCILIRDGSTIDFGDVTVGDTEVASTRTDIVNCAPFGLRIFSSVSTATSGTGPSAITWEPVLGAAGPNQFTYGVGQSAPPFTPIDDAFAVDVGGIPTASIRSFDHQLDVGSGSTTGVGSPFNATVTFLAASE